MDIGFIQAAAPASPPVPLADAAAAGASGDAAGAFDAALAETLAGARSPAVTSTGAPNAARVPQPQWLLTTLFAGDLAGAASAEGSAVAGEAPVADDSIDDAPADDAAPAAAAAIVVAPVVVADMPNPAAMPTGIGPGGGAEGATAGAPEGMSATAAQGQSHAGGAAANDVATRSGSAPHAHATTGESAHATTGETATRGAAPAPAPAPAAEVTTDRAAGGNPAAMRSDVRDESARDFRAPAAAVSPGVAGRAPQMQVASAPAATTAATTAVDVASRSAAAADTAIPAAVAADARGVATLAPGASSVDGSRTSNAAEAVASQGQAAALFPAGQDAPMTGGDQSNGQGRPSQDFMRFAAALAQVAPAAADDGGRAQVAGITSAPATAQPPASATPVAAPASVPTGATETPGPDNVGRLVQAMRVMARPGAWEANVRLNPEHLGEVTIAVRVERNTVSAVVNAESAGVCEWLEGQEQTMREGMAEHGLELDRFVVQRDGRRREAPEQEQPQGRRAQRGRQPAAGERFEIVV